MSKFTLTQFRQQLQAMLNVREDARFVRMLAGQTPSDFAWELLAVIGIIDAMTPNERADPECLDDSRVFRIARGSGRTAEQVRRLIAQFRDISEFCEQFDARRSTPNRDRSKASTRGFFHPSGDNPDRFFAELNRIERSRLLLSGTPGCLPFVESLLNNVCLQQQELTPPSFRQNCVRQVATSQIEPIADATHRTSAIQ